MDWQLPLILESSQLFGDISGTLVLRVNSPRLLLLRYFVYMTVYLSRDNLLSGTVQSSLASVYPVHS